VRTHDPAVGPAGRDPAPQRLLAPAGACAGCQAGRCDRAQADSRRAAKSRAYAAAQAAGGAYVVQVSAQKTEDRRKPPISLQQNIQACSAGATPAFGAPIWATRLYFPRPGRRVRQRRGRRTIFCSNLKNPAASASCRRTDARLTSRSVRAFARLCSGFRSQFAVGHVDDFAHRVMACTTLDGVGQHLCTEIARTATLVDLPRLCRRSAAPRRLCCFATAAGLARLADRETSRPYRDREARSG